MVRLQATDRQTGVGALHLEFIARCHQVRPGLVQLGLDAEQFGDGRHPAGIAFFHDALGFLGLGVQPPTPEWGTMLASARDYIERAWWVVSLPGLTILLSVLAINLMGDGLRDALDPKLKNAA